MAEHLKQCDDCNKYQLGNHCIKCFTKRAS